MFYLRSDITQAYHVRSWITKGPCMSRRCFPGWPG